MKTRKLLSGKSITELDKAITLEVYTKCPTKYKLIDMETGQVYIGQKSTNGQHWSIKCNINAK